MVGQIEDQDCITSQWFKKEGDAILLFGEAVDENDPLQGMGGSAYLQALEGVKSGRPPRVCLRREKQIADALRGWIACGLIQSAHDCSEGGLAVALIECCLSQERGRGAPKLLGAQVELNHQDGVRAEAMLFGESQARILVSVAKPFLPKVLGQAAILGIPAARIGVVGGRLLRIRYGESDYSWPLDDLHNAWWTAIRRRMESRPQTRSNTKT